MKKIIFTADFFVDEIFGGGELVNEEIIENLVKNGYDVHKVKCTDLTQKSIDCDLLIGNFVSMSNEMKKFIELNCRYSIIEHDHKYVPERDVSKYKNYLAPKSKIINRDFYKNAVQVYCQSKLHSEVVAKNLDINTINLSTSIWSTEHLDIIEKSITDNKIKKTMILNSQNPIKNTKLCIEYCEKNNINYDLIGPLPYNELIQSMSKYESVLVLPGVLETFNRFLVEARMLGCKVITDNKNGCTSEEWFSRLKGKELLDFIRASKQSFIENFIDTKNGKSEKFNRLFDKTYVINMESRKDRMSRSNKRLKSLGIDYERFEAIDGSKFGNHKLLLPGEVGCYMSHFNILKDAKQNNYKSILVLEDDVVFVDDMIDKFFEGYKHIPSDWEMIYLGCNHNKPYTRINDKVVKCNHAFTTSAMIIRNTVFEKLLIECSNMTKQIDVVFADMQEADKLKAYAFHPWLMYQEDGWSDIQGRDVSYGVMRR
jgi:hypothetical protein